MRGWGDFYFLKFFFFKYIYNTLSLRALFGLGCLLPSSRRGWGREVRHILCTASCWGSLTTSSHTNMRHQRPLAAGTSTSHVHRMWRVKPLYREWRILHSSPVRCDLGRQNYIVSHKNNTAVPRTLSNNWGIWQWLCQISPTPALCWRRGKNRGHPLCCCREDAKTSFGGHCQL